MLLTLSSSIKMGITFVVWIFFVAMKVIWVSKRNSVGRVLEIRDPKRETDLVRSDAHDNERRLASFLTSRITKASVDFP